MGTRFVPLRLHAQQSLSLQWCSLNVIVPRYSYRTQHEFWRQFCLNPTRRQRLFSLFKRPTFTVQHGHTYNRQEEAEMNNIECILGRWHPTYNWRSLLINLSSVRSIGFLVTHSSYEYLILKFPLYLLKPSCDAHVHLWRMGMRLSRSFCSKDKKLEPEFFESLMQVQLWAFIFVTSLDVFVVSNMCSLYYCIECVQT